MTVGRVDIKKNTDQLNFEDFLGGITRIVTIAGVENGRKEAQYDISIEGDERYWRPPATVLKILVAAWTNEASTWVGRRAELYGDPNVMFGRDRVGGIRVRRLSHIDAPLELNLSKTRGKRDIHSVDPLPDAPAQSAEPSVAQVAACTDQKQLREWYKIAGPERQAQILERKADLENEPGAES